MNTLNGRTAIITGAAGNGIGRSTAMTLAREGAKVIVNYRSSGEQAEAVVSHIRSMGQTAVAVQADVTQEPDVARLVEAASLEVGPVDILVNNAGGGWDVRDYTEMTPQQWHAVLAGEIDSTLLLLKYVLPGMRQRKWGRIVHVGMAGAAAMSGVRGMAPDYCMGKAARSWMTKAFAGQEAGSGVTVNCVAPAYTPAFESFRQAAEAASGGDAWLNRSAATPQDIAEGIAFFCSDKARFITANELSYR